MPSHFIAKLSRAGGPDPISELDLLVTQASQDAVQVGWFKTWHPGNELEVAGNSIALILFNPKDGGEIEAVVGRLLNRDRVGLPPDRARASYEGWPKLKRW